MMRLFHKPTILLCFVCSLMAIFLCGCNHSESNEEAFEATTNNSNAVSESRPHSYSLSVTGNAPGKSIIDYGGCSSHGYYSSILWPDEMYSENSPWIHISNITYVDYDTREMIFLCNVPGCAHNTEDCTSFIKYPNSIILFMDIREENLFCMALGALNGEVYSDEDLGRIYKMNPDGSNRTELIKLDPSESFSIEDPILSDDENLYVCKYIMKGKNEYLKGLFRINIETGKTEEIMEMDTSTFVLGTFEGRAVILVNRSNSDDPEYRITDIYDKSVIVDKKLGGNNNSYIYGTLRFDYVISGDVGSLIIHDMVTDKERVVEDIPARTSSNIALYEPYDNHIIWSYSDRETGEDSEYIVDLDRLSYTKNSLMANGLYGFEQFYSIVGMNDSYYLVISNVTQRKLQLTNQDGVDYEYSIDLWPEYGLLLKQDYWDSIDNIELIDDYTTYE